MTEEQKKSAKKILIFSGAVACAFIAGKRIGWNQGFNAGKNTGKVIGLLAAYESVLG